MLINIINLIFNFIFNINEIVGDGIEEEKRGAHSSAATIKTAGCRNEGSKFFLKKIFIFEFIFKNIKLKSININININKYRR